MSSFQLTNLSKYTACDISDALHQLQTPGSGFIPDLVPYGSLASRPLVGRASTVLFTDYDQDPGSRGQENVQINKEWVDSVEEDTVVIMSQPEGQQNAILGGIKAVRLAQRNIRGVVVHGRVRDIEELGKSGLTVRLFPSVPPSFSLNSGSGSPVLFLGRSFLRPSSLSAPSLLSAHMFLAG